MRKLLRTINRWAARLVLVVVLVFMVVTELARYINRLADEPTITLAVTVVGGAGLIWAFMSCGILSNEIDDDRKDIP